MVQQCSGALVLQPANVHKVGQVLHINQAIGMALEFGLMGLHQDLIIVSNKWIINGCVIADW